MTTLETVTLITAIAGAACGTLGAVLGIINTWAQLSKNKVRLRVVPKIAFTVNSTGGVVTGDRPVPYEYISELIKAGNRPRLCIEVVNLSSFPVTIHDVGFGPGDGKRHSIVKPEISPVGRKWPTRLEPRESITAYAGVGDLNLNPKIVTNDKAYAKTDCGKTVYGTSFFFKELMKQIREQASKEDKSG